MMFDAHFRPRLKMSLVYWCPQPSNYLSQGSVFVSVQYVVVFFRPSLFRLGLLAVYREIYQHFVSTVVMKEENAVMEWIIDISYTKRDS